MLTKFVIQFAMQRMYNLKLEEKTKCTEQMNSTFYNQHFFFKSYVIRDKHYAGNVTIPTHFQEYYWKRYWIFLLLHRAFLIITLIINQQMHLHKISLNLLTPNVNYSGRTAPLTPKVAFYIFIQQI